MKSAGYSWVFVVTELVVSGPRVNDWPFSLQGLYPINYLRNVALNHSKTDYVFLSDVDFIPVPGLHAYLQQNIEKGLLTKKDVSTWT